MDLAKFFDTVNHDMLMARIARKVTDKRVLRLVRAYLEAGVMIGGLYEKTEEGTPQGGPLSPLLANIMLDDFDKELEKRGHPFVRHADDCNIYVKSRRAGERVMEGVRRFVEGKFKLKVNKEKSAVNCRIPNGAYCGVRGRGLAAPTTWLYSVSADFLSETLLEIGEFFTRDFGIGKYLHIRFSRFQHRGCHFSSGFWFPL